jgi:tRNA threonylcarbamoyladenosine biosynthesis protein TsaE
MKYKKIITKNFNQTQKVGESLAKEIRQLANKTGVKKKAVVLELQGNLGSGKTTFLQGFAKGLGVGDKITSPTFVIYKKFKIKNKKLKNKTINQKSKFTSFYHFDCYRIQKQKEILDLGFKEIISNSENIVAVEWPEKIKNFLPKSAIIIKFNFFYSEPKIKADEKTRKLVINKFDKVF